MWSICIYIKTHAIACRRVLTHKINLIGTGADRSGSEATNTGRNFYNHARVAPKTHGTFCRKDNISNTLFSARITEHNATNTRSKITPLQCDIFPYRTSRWRHGINHRNCARSAFEDTIRYAVRIYAACLCMHGILSRANDGRI